MTYTRPSQRPRPASTVYRLRKSEVDRFIRSRRKADDGR